MASVTRLTAPPPGTRRARAGIADALGVTREPTGRLRHVAHLGVGTRAFSYAIRGKTPRPVPVRVELTAPDGTVWTWGPAEAKDRVTGPALDFCLLVTQRRHRDDLALAIEGPAATEWMAIAQAFAGPPGPDGPRPQAKPASAEEAGTCRQAYWQPAARPATAQPQAGPPASGIAR